ncbi:DUF4327 family protein [Aerosakkonema funiforme]|uniref:DUF4327 family protein n=1 Tax=Oscillatoriophycideae TaxID=1301283 RepID=UPI002AC83BFE|nr:DUF4327 family protein [Aerosakkonema funiforme]
MHKIKSTQYSLTVIQAQVYQLVHEGIVSREQRIYTLWKHMSAWEWCRIEQELEKSNFLLRDCIGDLIGWEG